MSKQNYDYSFHSDLGEKIPIKKSKLRSHKIFKS
jgi:hypothetical protein